MGTRAGILGFAAAEIVVIGLPVYVGWSWTVAASIHVALALILVTHHVVSHAWGNLDFGVTLFILAILVASVGPALRHIRQRSSESRTSFFEATERFK